MRRPPLPNPPGPPPYPRISARDTFNAVEVAYVDNAREASAKDRQGSPDPSSFFTTHTLPVKCNEGHTGHLVALHHQVRHDAGHKARLRREDVGDLLYLEGPEHVVVGAVQEDLVVGLHGGLAGDDDLALVEVFQTPEEVAVGVALGPQGTTLLWQRDFPQ